MVQRNIKLRISLCVVISIKKVYKVKDVKGLKFATCPLRLIYMYKDRCLKV